MHTTFPYVNSARKDGSDVLAPLVPFIVRSPDGEDHELFGLADSGSDVTLLPSEFIKLIDPEITRVVRARSFAGETKAYETSITITICGCTLTMPAFITEDDDTPILLGREGFFDAFDITFKQRDKTVILSKI